MMERKGVAGGLTAGQETGDEDRDNIAGVAAAPSGDDCSRPFVCSRSDRLEELLVLVG
jgi:hypothetical protein